MPTNFSNPNEDPGNRCYLNILLAVKLSESIINIFLSNVLNSSFSSFLFWQNFYNDCVLLQTRLFSTPYLIWMKNLKTSENTSKRFAHNFFNNIYIHIQCQILNSVFILIITIYPIIHFKTLTHPIYKLHCI